MQKNLIHFRSMGWTVGEGRLVFMGKEAPKAAEKKEGPAVDPFKDQEARNKRIKVLTSAMELIRKQEPNFALPDEEKDAKEPNLNLKLAAIKYYKTGDATGGAERYRMKAEGDPKLKSESLDRALQSILKSGITPPAAPSGQPRVAVAPTAPTEPAKSPDAPKPVVPKQPAAQPKDAPPARVAAAKGPAKAPAGPSLFDMTNDGINARLSAAATESGRKYDAQKRADDLAEKKRLADAARDAKKQEADEKKRAADVRAAAAADAMLKGTVAATDRNNAGGSTVTLRPSSVVDLSGQAARQGASLQGEPVVRGGGPVGPQRPGVTGTPPERTRATPAAPSMTPPANLFGTSGREREFSPSGPASSEALEGNEEALVKKAIIEKLQADYKTEIGLKKQISENKYDFPIETNNKNYTASFHFENGTTFKNLFTLTNLKVKKA